MGYPSGDFFVCGQQAARAKKAGDTAEFKMEENRMFSMLSLEEDRGVAGAKRASYQAGFNSVK
jgi:hypothetical protein